MCDLSLEAGYRISPFSRNFEIFEWFHRTGGGWGTVVEVGNELFRTFESVLSEGIAIGGAERILRVPNRASKTTKVGFRQWGVTHGP